MMLRVWNHIILYNEIWISHSLIIYLDFLQSTWIFSHAFSVNLSAIHVDIDWSKSIFRWSILISAIWFEFSLVHLDSWQSAWILRYPSYISINLRGFRGNPDVFSRKSTWQFMCIFNVPLTCIYFQCTFNVDLLQFKMCG